MFKMTNLFLHCLLRKEAYYTFNMHSLIQYLNQYSQDYAFIHYKLFILFALFIDFLVLFLPSGKNKNIPPTQAIMEHTTMKENEQDSPTCKTTMSIKSESL